MPGQDWNTPLHVYLQPTKLSDAQALPTSWLDRGTRGLQPGGLVHKEAVHICYPYSQHPLQTQVPFNLSVKFSVQGNLTTFW